MCWGCGVARVIATINLKGGVGKTTTTAALAEFMAAEFGQRVLLIDLDPQTNLTTMMIGEERWQELNQLDRTLATLFRGAVDPDAPAFDIEKALQRDVSPVRAVENVDLLASSLDLMDIQEGLSHQQYADPKSTRPLQVLLHAITPIADRYDYILVDCPPNLGMLTQNGLRLANGYLIPTIPDILSTYGIPQLQTRVRAFAERTGHPIARSASSSPSTGVRRTCTAASSNSCSATNGSRTSYRRGSPRPTRSRSPRSSSRTAPSSASTATPGSSTPCAC